MEKPQTFSDQLESWLQNGKPKTIADLVEVFQEKSFAICLLLLLLTSALPLPTGGLTHVFEIIAVLLSGEMILGKDTIWLPKRWQKVDISGIGKRKAVASFISKLRWVEKHSKPRLRGLIKDRIFLKITGLLCAVFSISAFLAPPFSGLDTLPSLAVVFIALALIFEDMILYIVGLLTGAIGIGTVLALGTVIFKSLHL